jgi:hypothetical protein
MLRGCFASITSREGDGYTLASIEKHHRVGFSSPVPLARFARTARLCLTVNLTAYVLNMTASAKVSSNSALIHGWAPGGP